MAVKPLGTKKKLATAFFLNITLFRWKKNMVAKIMYEILASLHNPTDYCFQHRP